MKKLTVWLSRRCPRLPVALHRDVGLAAPDAAARHWLHYI